MPVPAQNSRKLAGARLPVAPAKLTAGSAIASGDGFGSPANALDGDPQTFWVSAERGTGVKDHTWIGYAFAEPQSIRRIRLVQTSNSGFRQDFVRIEKSLDEGANWVAAAPAPVQLRGYLDWIDLAESAPARLWRLVAAGDNATTSEHAWTVIGLEFLVLDSPEPGMTAVPAELSGGSAVASEDGFGSPANAFDSSPQTFWISAERGTQ